MQVQCRRGRVLTRGNAGGPHEVIANALDIVVVESQAAARRWAEVR